jgi:hypothetical protein
MRRSFLLVDLKAFNKSSKNVRLALPSKRNRSGKEVAQCICYVIGAGNHGSGSEV